MWLIDSNDSFGVSLIFITQKYHIIIYEDSQNSSRNMIFSWNLNFEIWDFKEVLNLNFEDLV
jgi:hypothetical protein